MKIAAIIDALADILAGPHAKPVQKHHARSVAQIVHQETRRSSIDENVVAALIKAESGGDPLAIGRAGEKGLLQVKPDGMALYVCKAKELANLFDPRLNIRCGLRLLQRAYRLCGGPPLNFLGIFNGKHDCGPSRYARRVLALLPQPTVFADVAP